VAVRARDAIIEELSQLDDSSFSMIHADLNPYNVVVSEQGLHVIDFDDSGFGWHHYELAVALYNYRAMDGFDGIQAAMIEGYRDVRDLADSVVEALPMFYLVRSLVHLGWRAARPEHGVDLSGAIERVVGHARAWLG
jgi:Ser/Thr protein kinase RdoA (MazF antagonist)